MDPLDLFISHSSDDVKVARDLRAILDEAGYSSFMAPDDVIGTDTWTEQILDAIGRSRAMVVLVSAAANRSNHVSREVNLALGRDRPVLPIRIEDVGPEGSLEYLLSLVQRIDAFPLPITSHERAILRRVEALLKTADENAAGAGKRPEPGDRILKAGSKVGGFTIAEQIGEGGQATVYRAHQREPKRDVALKVIRADQRADATDRARFLAEQDTLAGLEHPSIVPIYAAGEDDGVLFIAVRLIDGPDLGSRLRTGGTMSPIDVVRILRPVADALDFAHQHGVIHRDVKPSNILIDSGSRTYLSDFGLGQRTGGPSTTERPGIVVGTLEYMAPEQLSGDDAALTPAADIYALGCVAYTCLAGQPPFTGDGPEAIAAARSRGPVPSLGTSRPDLPGALDAVLARALALAPDERYASATELVDALAVAGASEQTRPIVIADELPPLARAQAWVRANTPVAAVGGVAGLLVLVLLASRVFGGGGGEASPSPSSADIPTARPTVDLPTPTPRVATPTPAPAATPTPTPTPKPPDTYPNAAELQLIAALPQGSGIQDGCRRFADPYAGATAAISCNDPSGGTARIYYQSWPDQLAMNEKYEEIVDQAGVAPGGRCADSIPADAPWNLGDGVRQGDLACYAEDRNPGRVSYFWTHDDSLVMVFWSAPTNKAGYEFWKKWVVAPR